jgi:uncharacterized protein (TIGR02996 family)
MIPWTCELCNRTYTHDREVSGCRCYLENDPYYTTPEPTLAELLRNILENPADPMARLLYADKLEEEQQTEADAARVEFIRIQVHTPLVWFDNEFSSLSGVPFGTVFGEHSSVYSNRGGYAAQLWKQFRCIWFPEASADYYHRFEEWEWGFPFVFQCDFEKFDAGHFMVFKTQPILKLVDIHPIDASFDIGTARAAQRYWRQYRLGGDVNYYQIGRESASLPPFRYGEKAPPVIERDGCLPYR